MNGSEVATEAEADADVQNYSLLMADGLLQIYEKKMKDVQEVLVRLTNRQGLLVRQIVHENCRFTGSRESFDLTEMFNMTKLYHHKLLSVKKDMVQIQEQVAKMKKRALKLQQQKQKEALQREQQREREREREEQLIAKPPKRN